MKTSRWFCAAIVPSAILFGQTACAGPEYQANLDKTFSVTPGGRLVVSADMGPIHVVAGPSDKVEIHVLRKVQGGTKSDADELFARHEVTFAQDGNTVSVISRNKHQSSWGWNVHRRYLEVSYEVTAPEQFDMELGTAGGDIRVGDLAGKLDARTSAGAIHAGKITGSTVAKDAGGDIVLGEVGQDVTAGTTSGSIEIQKAGANVEASDAGGNIRVGEAGGSVKAQTASGSITLGAVRGLVTANDAGGDIHIASANGAVKAETTSGSISIGSADGEVKARDVGGDIHIDLAKGNVTAQTASGSIHIKLALGPVQAKDAGGDITIDSSGGSAEAQTTSGSIRIGSARGKIDARDAGGSIHVANAGGAVNAETSSGAIDVSFSAAPKEDCRLVVLGGDIDASLPPDAAMEVDAQCVGGKVESELPLTIQGKTQEGTLQGQLNGGGPKIKLRSTSGNIRLKRSTATPIQTDASK
ncbi:MAG: DUF4097 family beta strand repeat-containing protein [Verrucomicrobiota bacterium]|jgi:DUF4097 and DUF4098 domain-containing protein YvlB